MIKAMEFSEQSGDILEVLRKYDTPLWALDLIFDDVKTLVNNATYISNHDKEIFDRTFEGE